MGCDGPASLKELRNEIVRKSRLLAKSLLTDWQKGKYLNNTLSELTKFTKWAGLSFSTHKCASLTCVNNTPRRYIDPFSPSLDGEHIPAMKWEEHYKYLGWSLGANPKVELGKLADTFMKISIVIMNSALTDWQKVDAINKFAKPKLDHSLRTLLPERSWAHTNLTGD